MRTRKVVVLPYDVAWQSAFGKIKGEIEEAIGDLIIGIEHIGSTSVKEISAKPCIDIDVIIEDLMPLCSIYYPYYTAVLIIKISPKKVSIAVNRLIVISRRKLYLDKPSNFY
jgi:GrpB-like predicted nucleotidyltransferase (UPF0157 family)